MCADAETNQYFSKMISRLRDDDVSRRIQTDPLLLKIGLAMFMIKTADNFNDTSQRLRAASKLLGELRTQSQDSSGTYIQFLRPELWEIWERAFLAFKVDKSLLIRMGHVLLTILSYARGVLLKQSADISMLTSFEQLFKLVLYNRSTYC